MFDKIICPNCGKKTRKKNKFCSQCGSPLSEIICSNCGIEVSAKYKFCPKCGTSTIQLIEQMSIPTSSPKKTGKIRVWQRDPIDFAHRFEISDIKGLFRKKISVVSGTKAIFLQDGRFSGVLPPGTYTVDGLIHTISNLNFGEKATVILVDDSDVRLDFNIEGLKTKEDFSAGVKGNMVVKTEDPVLFFNNLMKGREHMSTTDITTLFGNEMLNLLQSKIRNYSFEELYGNLELKKEIEQDFEHLLNTTLTRNGLKLVYLPYFDYDESYWKEIIEPRGESARALIWKREQIIQDAQLQEKKYEEDIATKKRTLTYEESDYEISEIRDNLEDKRSELTKRARTRLTDEKMDEIRNVEDLAKFLYEVDKDKLIQENEMFDLKQIFKENQIDRAVARKLMLERIEQRHELDMHIERDGYEHDKKIKEAEARIRIERLEDEEDARAAREGIELLKSMKSAKREDAAGYQGLEIEKMQTIADLEEQRLKVRSASTDEALISMTEGKQVEHLSELARMKLATGLTEEQILALGAKDSAAITEVFKEKYKSMSAEEIRKIYEDRLEDKDAFTRTVQEMADKDGDRIERMAARALEQMGTTAATRAQSMAPGGMTVVTGISGGGQPVVVGESMQSTSVPPVQEVKKVVICQECNTEVPVGMQFCTNCGAAVGRRK